MAILGNHQAALKIGVTFQYERFIKNARVMRPDPSSRRRICLRDKEADNLKEMFLDRARLHRHGYQHRVTLTIDVMLVGLENSNNALGIS